MDARQRHAKEEAQQALTLNLPLALHIAASAFLRNQTRARIYINRNMRNVQHWL